MTNPDLYGITGTLKAEGYEVMRGVIYARYSSENQREESIKGQLRENIAYAKKNGIEIVGTYIDRAVSAKTDKRDEFQRMIKDSAKRALTLLSFGSSTDSLVTVTTRQNIKCF